MKAKPKARFLQQLNSTTQDAGFTLIELLVVIIIIGILSAIALPSFLSQAAKVRQSEAKSNVGTLNRGQQAYYFENFTFTDDIGKLGVGVINSDNYSYSAVPIHSITSSVANKAKAISADTKGYVGGVFANAGQTTVAILCEVKTPGIDLPENPDSASACHSATQSPL